jgi:hypothetical protein
VPQETAPGKPWVWRTSFPDFHAEVDLELVKGGFGTFSHSIKNLE